MLVGKKHLTQSEKHKRFTDGQGKVPSALLIHRSVNQISDCPQNLAQSKKLANQVEELEKQKSKSVAKINGDKHLLKLKYKGLLKNQDCDPEIEETFFLQPGFRFHRNGDLRKVKDPRVALDVEQKASSLSTPAKSNSSSQSLGSRWSKSQSQKSTTSVGKSTQASGEGDGPVSKKVNVEKTIAEIERDLKKIKLDKDLININKRIGDVRNSLTFIRAHTNDYKPAIPFIVQDHENMFSSSHASKDSCKPGSVESIKRLSRHFNKINCTACENRLKHDNIKTSPEKSPTCNQKWQFAPRGVYVPQLESKGSPKKTRPAKSAKSASKDELNERSSERRLSKSASNTSSQLQRKKGSCIEARAHKTKHSKPKTLVNRLKESNPEQTQSEKNVGVTWKTKALYSGDCLMSSPNITTAPEESDNLGEMESASKDDLSQVSKEALAKDDISHKIASFYDTLPDVKPSITTWRQSSGQLVTWKPHESLHATKSSQECQMTWAKYQQSKKLVSLEQELQFKVYLNSQEKPCGDPNSYEELAKCRYLREFKMRKNLPEK